MSRPISRENSSNNLTLNPDVTTPQQQQNAKTPEQAANPPAPQLTQKTEAKQPQPSGDAGFSKADWKKHGQGSDEQSAQKQDHPKEKSSQGDEQKSSSKQADAAPKGKAASSNRKVNVPSLKLGGSGTATLKSRSPVSTSTSNPLGSHRVMSPRTGEATQPNSSSSSSTSNTNTEGQASSSAQSARSLPTDTLTPSSQTPPDSNGKAPASVSGNKTKAQIDTRVMAKNLSARSLKILESALATGKKLDDKIVNGKVVQGKIVNANIDPEDLGYLMVDVETAGFTLPTSVFAQGKSFLRAGLLVYDFKDSNGVTHNSINLIEQFLQPMAEKTFNTHECNDVINNLEKNYLEAASTIEKASEGLTSDQALENKEIKNTIEKLIQPVTTWICGKNETLASSNFPYSWKLFLRGIDDGVVQWAKKINCTNMEEFMGLRSKAMVAFISTRGPMMLWSIQLQTNGKKVGLLISYLNSYFAKRANKFIANIMLSRKDSEGDAFDKQIREDLTVSARTNELVSKAPKKNAQVTNAPTTNAPTTNAPTTNSSGRRELMKSKTLSYTKNAPTSSSATVDKGSTALSPRELKQTENVYGRQNERQKFFRDFSRLAKLATLDPDFYRALRKHVDDMMPREFKNFKKYPAKICMRFINEFYKDVSDKVIQEKVKAIRAALDAIDPKDIAALVPEARKAKSIAKPEPELIKDKEILFERKKLFLGNFVFHTNIGKVSKDFLSLFKDHILELSLEEYLKFEKAPIYSVRAYVEKLYSGLISTSKKADHDRLEAEKIRLLSWVNNVPPGSIKGLMDDTEAAFKPISKPTSDAVAEMASPWSISGLELPAKPVEENEKQATTAPVSTASIQPLQSSLTPSSSTAAVKLVQENEISAERRNDFLDKFYELANINRISIDFDDAFKKHILGLSTSDYLKFLESPIDNCRAFLAQFYDLPFHKETELSLKIAFDDKDEFFYLLIQAEDKKLEAINKLAVTSAAPVSTASIQPLQSSLTPSSSTAAVKLVQENEISAERRNDFLDKFYGLANINRISIDFDDAFKKHILGLSTSDYLKFLESPIANCRALLNQFYDLPFHKETKQSRQIAREDKTTFFYRLYQAEDKKLEEINKLAAASAAPISTASIQPLQDSRTPPVASVGVKPVAEDVESLKAESSSSESTEIVSDSDTDVDDAASQSEKTEES